MESDERVILIAPTYYKELAEVLHNEPKRNLANLMMWKAAKGSISYLNKAARDTIEDYVKKLSGKKIDTPRWKTCTATAAGSFSAAVGKLYVQKHFQEDAKESMTEMVSDIKDEFRHILNEVCYSIIFMWLYIPIHSTYILGIKVRNLKIDFDTGDAQHRVKQ